MDEKDTCKDIAQIPNYKHLTTNYREGDGTPLQYSCLENLMDRGAW